jgi:hypothetical protein
MGNYREVRPAFSVISATEGLALEVLECIAKPPFRDPARKRRRFSFQWQNGIRPGRVMETGKHGNRWARLTLKRFCDGQGDELRLVTVEDGVMKESARLTVTTEGAAILELNVTRIKEKFVPRWADMIAAHAVWGNVFAPKKAMEKVAAMSA